MECVQRPGELIYIPEGWNHGTINIGQSLAIAAQHPDMHSPVMRAQQKAQRFLMNKDYLRATVLFDKLLNGYHKYKTARPSQASLYYNRARALKKLSAIARDEDEEHELLIESLSDYEQAYTIDPHVLNYALAYGEALASMGYGVAAVTVMEKALQHKEAKTDEELLYTLALAYDQIGAEGVHKAQHYRQKGDALTQQKANLQKKALVLSHKQDWRAMTVLEDLQAISPNDDNVKSLMITTLQRLQVA